MKSSQSVHLFILTTLLVLYAIASFLGVYQIVFSTEIRATRDRRHPAWHSSTGFYSTIARRGQWASPIYIPSVLKSNDEVKPAILTFEISNAPMGNAINISTVHLDFGDPPRFTVLVNGEYIASHVVQTYYWPEIEHGRDVTEYLLPNSTNSQQQTTVQLVNEAGAWFGRILVVPLGRLLPLIRQGLPLLYLAIMVYLAWRGAISSLRYRLCLFAVMTFFLYSYTLFTKKVAPNDGFFWDDAMDYIKTVMRGELTFKAAKHILIAPLLFPLAKLLRLIIPFDLYVMIILFGAIGMLNALTAYLCFHKIVKDIRAATLVSVSYALSFAPWVFGSLFESYSLAALSANLYLLYLLYSRLNSSLALLVGGLLVSLTGLAHPPLLILAGLGIAKIFEDDVSRSAKWRRSLFFSIIALSFYVLGRIAIQQFFPVPENNPWVAEKTPQGIFTFAIQTIKQYANIQHLTFENLGNVLVGQFLHAVIGHPLGYRWFNGWQGVLDYLHSPSGFLALAGYMAVLGKALLTLAGSPAKEKIKWMMTSILVLIPYVLFYWYFNPREMLLYSAPFVIFIFFGLLRLEESPQSRRFRIMWTVLAIALAARNTLCLASYH